MLSPKNWTSFQHYKDRSPAWIKLHRGLLDDFAFSRLPVASRALAPLLWLLASEYEDGKITASFEEIAFRLRMSDPELNEAIKPLIDAGFFISDSEVLALCKQEAIPEREKKRRETRIEREDIRAVANATRPVREEEFEKFWRSYPKREGANPKAPARMAFLAALKSGADPPAIAAGAAAYAADPSTKVGTSYVAQAVTWLRQKRWEDHVSGNVAIASDELERHRRECLKRAENSEEVRRDTGMGANGTDHSEELRSSNGMVRGESEAMGEQLAISVEQSGYEGHR